MKYQYLVLFIVAGCIFRVSAQPSITSDILFQIGDAAAVHYSTTDFDPGPAGADVEWDFSTLSSSYQIQWQAVSPQSTGFQDSFPSASIAFTIPGNMSAGVLEDTYAFYEKLGSTFHYLGSTLNSDLSGETQTSFFTLNEDPDELYDFPLSFGEMSEDEVAGTNTINAGDNTFVTQRTGTTTTEVDAYGTLHTPMGTFSNTLRVKRTEALTDDFNGISTTQEIVRYDWLSPNHRYILMHMEEIIVRDFLGNEQSRSTQTYYSEPAIINSVDQADANVQTLRVFPNPSVDRLYFDLPTSDLARELNLYVFNSGGQVIQVEAIKNGTHYLDVVGWPSGQYWLEIRNSSSTVYRAQFTRL